jgi:hypothetical protein
MFNHKGVSMKSTGFPLLAALGTLSLWISCGYLVPGWMHFWIRLSYLAVPLVAVLIVLLLIRKAGPGRVLKRFITQWCKFVGTYMALVTVGSVLVLLLCSAVGYLPYSDRPGPGWGNTPPHLPGIDEIKYFSHWTIFLLPICYFFGSLLFVFMGWMNWFGAPTWLTRMLGGIFSAMFGAISVAAAGWVISISVVVSNTVGILCLLFGLVALPSLALERPASLSPFGRTIGIAVNVLFVVGMLVYPFIHH